VTDTVSTRSTDTSVAPDPGTYKIDASHSMAEFVGRHLMVTKVRGRFTDFDGEIVVGETPEDSAVNVTIQAASIDSGEQRRDDHLRGADFLDVEQFPTLEFHSRKVEQSKGGVRVEGDLTIKGVTRPVVLDASYDGSFGDPWDRIHRHHRDRPRGLGPDLERRPGVRRCARRQEGEDRADRLCGQAVAPRAARSAPSSVGWRNSYS
jgi:polyisoprenoid-binding protein YceI